MSQVYWVYLLVSMLSKADCHVIIKVAESADVEKGGTKVKVRPRLPLLHRHPTCFHVPFLKPRVAKNKGLASMQ